MGIDWITFSAQLVNLAILVYLLTVFVQAMLNRIDGARGSIRRNQKIRDMAAELKNVWRAEPQTHAELKTQRQQILRRLTASRRTSGASGT